MISLTADEMRRVDDLAIWKYKIHLEQMMELAGYNLARCARRSLNGSLTEKGGVVLAGKGNNGGGGLVAARHLSNWGCKVTVVVSHGDSLGGVVKERLETLKLMGLEIVCFDEVLDLKGILSASDLVVDALIGYSLRGSPRPPISSIIEVANESGLPAVSRRSSGRLGGADHGDPPGGRSDVAKIPDFGVLNNRGTGGAAVEAAAADRGRSQPPQPRRRDASAAGGTARSRSPALRPSPLPSR